MKDLLAGMTKDNLREVWDAGRNKMVDEGIIEKDKVRLL